MMDKGTRKRRGRIERGGAIERGEENVVSAPYWEQESLTYLGFGVGILELDVHRPQALG